MSQKRNGDENEKVVWTNRDMAYQNLRDAQRKFITLSRTEKRLKNKQFKYSSQTAKKKKSKFNPKKIEERK